MRRGPLPAAISRVHPARADSKLEIVARTARVRPSCYRAIVVKKHVWPTWAGQNCGRFVEQTGQLDGATRQWTFFGRWGKIRPTVRNQFAQLWPLWNLIVLLVAVPAIENKGLIEFVLAKKRVQPQHGYLAERGL